MSFEGKKFINTESSLFDFGIHERKNSTEERPILTLTYGGIVFEAVLDILQNSYTMQHIDTAGDTDPADSLMYEGYARQVIENELENRRTTYGDYFV